MSSHTDHTRRRGLLIADDFGLGPEHNAVILDLLERGRIDGTSVFIDGYIVEADMQRLAKLRDEGASIGLHLNLTEAFAASECVMPLEQLLAKALARRLPPNASADFERQARRFRERFRHLPDHYDGHQHVHCLPGLSTAAARLPREAACWMRLPLPRSASGLALNIRAGGPKVVLVAALAVAARPVFRHAGWHLNDDFSGFLRLNDPRLVARRLPDLLDRRTARHVTMVHPGSVDDLHQIPGHAALSREIEAEILGRGTIGTGRSV